MPLTRRQFAASSLAFSGALVPPAISSEPKLKIVFTGGHPGDPECGCAGTISRYTSLGHNVALLYLNRGEGFCRVGTDCAKIRTAEARHACQILNARPLFASQVDGQAIIDNGHYEEFRRLLDAETPDILFTQWPVDHHRDHRAISQLALDAWLNSSRKSAFLYYESSGRHHDVLPHPLR